MTSLNHNKLRRMATDNWTVCSTKKSSKLFFPGLLWSEPHKGPTRRKSFPFHDVTGKTCCGCSFLIDYAGISMSEYDHEEFFVQAIDDAGQDLFGVCGVFVCSGVFTTICHLYRKILNRHSTKFSGTIWISVGFVYLSTCNLHSLLDRFLVAKTHGSTSIRHRSAWWRHQMETFFALLALCAGKSPVPVTSPHKGQWRGALMFSLICAWINK